MCSLKEVVRTDAQNEVTTGTMADCMMRVIPVQQAVLGSTKRCTLSGSLPDLERAWLQEVPASDGLVDGWVASSGVIWQGSQEDGDAGRACR
jgi:hypothetical protein